MSVTTDVLADVEDITQALGLTDESATAEAAPAEATDPTTEQAVLESFEPKSIALAYGQLARGTNFEFVIESSRIARGSLSFASDADHLNKGEAGEGYSWVVVRGTFSNQGTAALELAEFMQAELTINDSQTFTGEIDFEEPSVEPNDSGQMYLSFRVPDDLIINIQTAELSLSLPAPADEKSSADSVAEDAEALTDVAATDDAAEQATAAEQAAPTAPAELPRVAYRINLG